MCRLGVVDGKGGCILDGKTHGIGISWVFNRSKIQRLRRNRTLSMVFADDDPMLSFTILESFRNDGKNC